MNKEAMIRRIDELIDIVREFEPRYTTRAEFESDYIPSPNFPVAEFHKYKVGCLSFIATVAGKDHIYYTSFEKEVVELNDIVYGKSVMEMMRNEIESG